MTILFDRFLILKNGFVPGIKMTPLLNDVSATVVESKKENSNNMINVNNLHKILGHCGEASARLTGKALGYEVIGTFDKTGREEVLHLVKDFMWI